MSSFQETIKKAIAISEGRTFVPIRIFSGNVDKGFDDFWDSHKKLEVNVFAERDTKIGQTEKYKRRPTYLIDFFSWRMTSLEELTKYVNQANRRRKVVKEIIIISYLQPSRWYPSHRNELRMRLISNTVEIKKV